MEYHYVYKLTDPNTKEFYIGSRTSNVLPHEDDYMGSMVTWQPDKSKLVKEIIKDEFESRELAFEYESELIKENIKNALNRNYYIPNKGFSTYGLTFEFSEEHKRKLSETAKLRDTNPMTGKSHKESSKNLMRKKAKGRYTLVWFINKYGEKIGTEKYENKRTMQSHISKEYYKTHDHIVTDQMKKKISEANSKKVGQYTKDGQLIKIWDSMTEASKFIGISFVSISAVCDPNRVNKTAGGFVWKKVT